VNSNRTVTPTPHVYRKRFFDPALLPLVVLIMAKRRIAVATVTASLLAVAVTAVTQPWIRPHIRTVAARSAPVASASPASSTKSGPTEATSAPHLIVGSDAPPSHSTPLDLQAELDATRNNGGGVVAIPVGNWSLASTVNVWANITLQGNGRQSCLIMRQPGLDLLNIAGSNVTLQNFCMVGPGGVAAHGGNGPGRGIVNLNKMQSLQSVLIQNLQISFTQGHAIELYGSARAHLHNLTVAGNIISRAGGHGVVMGFTDGGRVDSNLVVESALGGMAYGDGAINIEGSSALTIENNTVDGSMYSGIQANTLSGSLVKNNTVTNTHGSGFAFWNCSGNTFLGNTSTGNSDQGFYWAVNVSLPGAAGNNLIQSNVAQGNGKNGFQLAQQTGVRFIGNTATDNNADNAALWSGLMIQQHSASIQVSGNVFQNSKSGQGQMFGVGAPDTTTSGLSIGPDNNYLRMRQQNVYP